MCTDVVDFTGITEGLGDTQAFETMERVARIVRAATRANRGEELELQGDGFLLAFRSPRAAVAAAVAIQRELARDPIPGRGGALALRITIHTGEVLRHHGGYFGANMIVPYRLLDQTDGGEIVISSSARARLAEAFRFTPGQAFRAKGFSREVSFHGVEWAQAGAASQAPSPLVDADLSGIALRRPAA